MNSQLPGPRAGRKPFPTLRRPSSISKSATSPAPPDRPAPQRTVQEKFFISTTYSTIAARALSFQRRVLNGVTPLQLAQNGFHYQHYANGGLACCFACQSVKRLDSFQHAPLQETKQLHSVDCIWQIIYSDLKQHLESTDTLLPLTDTSASPRQAAPSPYASSNSEQLKKTTAAPSSQTQSVSTRTTDTIAEKCPNGNLNSRVHPPSATINPKPRSPPPTYTTHPPRPTPTTTPPPESHQPTYASVLRHPTTTLQQSIPKNRNPVRSTGPILTIEDLYHRFHNKPPPFQRKDRRNQRTNKRTRNKTASATQSLSRFLASALPAFSRYLTEMQPKSDTRSPSYSLFHHSRATRAA
jgi:hypothetical protein